MAGIECEFAEKVSKGIQSECPICLLVLREPYQVTCCGKSFCKECIERVKSNNQSCPTCNDRGFNLFHNKGLQQSLYDFQIYCSHKSKGCEWIGELRELDKHLNSEPPADKSLEGCPFTVINCPLSHTTGCEVRLPRKDVKIHMNDKLLTYVVKLSQDNKSLNSQLQMVKKQLHSVEVDNEHLKQQVAELERRIKELNKAHEMFAHTGQPLGQVDFTMAHFQQHKQDDDEWLSPPFYTHPHGYKMCMCVWPNGFSTGKGTHLGVTIHLMRGEFDDQLKWPFRGDITVQLLNQEEDKDHIMKEIPFTDGAPNDVVNRVTKEEMNPSGCGLSEVLPNSSLERGYLKDDCLKFCITNVVLP